MQRRWLFLDKLSYKGWSWPENPEIYHQTAVREPVYEKNSSGDTVFTGMGPVKRTVTGSGAFFGETAYDDFLELIALFDQTGYGPLVHPVWGTYQMYFTELELTQEPKADYVAYQFEFREADESGAIPQ